MADSAVSVSSYSSLEVAPSDFAPASSPLPPSPLPPVYDASYQWDESEVVSPLSRVFDSILRGEEMKGLAVGGIIPVVAVVVVVAVVAVIALEIKRINTAVTAKGRTASSSWLETVASGLNEVDAQGAFGRM